MHLLFWCIPVKILLQFTIEKIEKKCDVTRSPMKKSSDAFGKNKSKLIENHDEIYCLKGQGRDMEGLQL